MQESCSPSYADQRSAHLVVCPNRYGGLVGPASRRSWPPRDRRDAGPTRQPDGGGLLADLLVTRFHPAVLEEQLEEQVHLLVRLRRRGVALAVGHGDAVGV